MPENSIIESIMADFLIFFFYINIVTSIVLHGVEEVKRRR